VIIIIPPRYDYESDLSNSLLQNIGEDDNFRECIISEDDLCIRRELSNSIYGYYNYTYEIVYDPYKEVNVTLPDTKINMFPLFLAGNKSYYNPKIFKLYYWSILE
jgi:hypothetical protein